MTTLNNYIKVTLDYAPKENGTEFYVWCDKYGFQPLGSGRRAWCGQYQSYFRGALGVACTEAGETFLFEESDLADLTQDRQHIAEVLCELLEGEKIWVVGSKGAYEFRREKVEWPDGKITYEDEGFADAYNRALDKAQALIRQTLDPISSNER